MNKIDKLSTQHAIETKGKIEAFNFFLKKSNCKIVQKSQMVSMGDELYYFDYPYTQGVTELNNALREEGVMKNLDDKFIELINLAPNDIKYIFYKYHYSEDCYHVLEIATNSNELKNNSICLDFLPILHYSSYLEGNYKKAVLKKEDVFFDAIDTNVKSILFATQKRIKSINSSVNITIELQKQCTKKELKNIVLMLDYIIPIMDSNNAVYSEVVKQTQDELLLEKEAKKAAELSESLFREKIKAHKHAMGNHRFKPILNTLKYRIQKKYPKDARTQEYLNALLSTERFRDYSMDFIYNDDPQNLLLLKDGNDTIKNIIEVFEEYQNALREVSVPMELSVDNNIAEHPLNKIPLEKLRVTYGVLEELFVNARKHTQEKCAIFVSVKTVSDTCLLVVFENEYKNTIPKNEKGEGQSILHNLIEEANRNEKSSTYSIDSTFLGGIATFTLKIQKS